MSPALKELNTAWKVSKYGVKSGPNTGKYRPELTPYLDTIQCKPYVTMMKI